MPALSPQSEMIPERLRPCPGGTPPRQHRRDVLPPQGPACAPVGGTSVVTVSGRLDGLCLLTAAGAPPAPSSAAAIA